ncbi:MAG: hypothetical protein ACR2OD_02345 [Gaiellaceae bacterium]
MTCAIALGLGLGLALSACGGGGSSGSGDGGRFSTLLAAVPDSATARGEVIVTDWAAAREAAGVSTPSLDDEDALGTYLRALSGLDSPVSIFSEFIRNPQFEDFQTEMGFSILDLDAELTAGSAPETFQLLEGDLDFGRLESAAQDDEIWSSQLTVPEYAGVDYLAWGEDFEVDLANRSAARQLGESLRIGLVDDRLVWVKSTGLMESAIDVAAGEASSLADVDVLAGLAGVLDDAGAYTGFLSADSALFALPAPDIAESLDPSVLELSGLGAAYVGLATGATVVDGAPGLILAIAHADSTTATANASRLETTLREGRSAETGQPWSDLIQIEEILVEETLVIARLLSDSSSLWIDLPFRRSSLFWVQ